MCFNHLSEAHAHMSSFVANISSLAKITNPKTFDMVMKASGKTNDPGQCPGALPESGPRSTPEDHSRRMPVQAGKSHPPPARISHTQEPWYGPTRFLAAAVWLHLKCKFFNSSTAKEACTLRLRCEPNSCQSCCRAKSTLVDPPGAAKGRHKQSHTVACEGDVAGDKPLSPSPPPRK